MNLCNMLHYLNIPMTASFTDQNSVSRIRKERVNQHLLSGVRDFEREIVRYPY